MNGGETQTEQNIQSSVWINTKWVPWFPVPSANQEPLRHPVAPLDLHRHCGKSLEGQSVSPHTQICSRLDIVSGCRQHSGVRRRRNSTGTEQTLGTPQALFKILSIYLSPRVALSSSLYIVKFIESGHSKNQKRAWGAEGTFLK